MHWVEVAFTLLRRACVPPKPQKLKIYLSCATFIWPRLLLEHIRSNDKHIGWTMSGKTRAICWSDKLNTCEAYNLYICSFPNQNHVETFRSLIQAHNWKDAEVMSIIYHLFCFFPSFLSEGNLPSPALYTSWPRGTLTTKLSAQRCKKQHGDCNF